MSGRVVLQTPGFGSGIGTSCNLAAMARVRGIEAVRGDEEHLPFQNGYFDTILHMTVICFPGYPFGFLRGIPGNQAS